MDRVDSSSFCWAALYTKHLTKKLKTYHDGFVVLKEAHTGSRTALLLDEDGKVLCRCETVPVSLRPDSDDHAEGLACFQGFLVSLDGISQSGPGNQQQQGSGHQAESTSKTGTGEKENLCGGPLKTTGISASSRLSWAAAAGRPRVGILHRRRQSQASKPMLNPASTAQLPEPFPSQSSDGYAQGERMGRGLCRRTVSTKLHQPTPVPRSADNIISSPHAHAHGSLWRRNSLSRHMEDPHAQSLAKATSDFHRSSPMETAIRTDEEVMHILFGGGGMEPAGGNSGLSLQLPEKNQQHPPVSHCRPGALDQSPSWTSLEMDAYTSAVHNGHEGARHGKGQVGGQDTRFAEGDCAELAWAPCRKNKPGAGLACNGSSDPMQSHVEAASARWQSRTGSQPCSTLSPSVPEAAAATMPFQPQAAHRPPGLFLGRQPVEAHRMPDAQEGSTTHRPAQPPQPFRRASFCFPDTSDLPMKRTQVVPDSFDSFRGYVDAWEKCLNEEINLRAAEVAGSLHRAAAAAVIAGGRSQGMLPPTGAAELRRRIGPSYHGECKLAVAQAWRHPARGGKRRRFMDGEPDEEFESEGGNRQRLQWFLTIKTERRKQADYRRGDVWFVGASPTLGSEANVRSQGKGQRRPSSQVAVVRNLWHGPDKDGKMEVEVLHPTKSVLPKRQNGFALQGPNAAMEFTMLESMKRALEAHDCGVGGEASAAHHQAPLLQALLKPVKPRPQCTPEGMLTKEMKEHVDSVSQKFSLNKEQRACLVSSIVPWFSNSPENEEPALPVCLIHGPFGTGKSALLVALIHFMCKQMAPPELKNQNVLLTSTRACPSVVSHGKPKACTRQILVAAHTNVAVDRVLRGLADSGFTDILRVGSVQRITDKSLLRYSLHSVESKRGSDAVAELKEMLATATGAEAQHIRAELEALQCGKAKAERQARLKSAQVVGVTCCSSVLPALEGHRFEVLVLDECSQMIEPLSLLPILTSGCRFLVAAGDPLQLPPVVSRPSEVAGPGSGLARPMFVRLQSIGHKAHLLRRQYRCHPEISAVPNQHFYGGRLLDGCRVNDRLALVPRLPPLTFMDVHGEERRAANSASVCNQEEAMVVARTVQLLAKCGVAAEDIGVICFYRAQVQLVIRLLQRIQCCSDGVVEVATVDAFQGAEKEVVILTSAVTRQDASFSSDAHRLNVALTRAKSHLLLVGCRTALAASAPAMKDLIGRCSQMPGGYCRQGELPQALLEAVAEVSGHAEPS